MHISTRFLIRSFVSASLAVFTVCTASAQSRDIYYGTIRGQVVSSSDNSPVANVTVSATHFDQGYSLTDVTQSDAHGNFEFKDAIASQYSLFFSAEYFYQNRMTAIKVTDGSVVEVRALLQPFPR